MASLEIKKFNEPVLRKKCKEVEEITPDIKELVLNMTETMKKKQGVGLSAPQVGISKKIIIVLSNLENSEVLRLINPKIIKKSNETEIEEEGCLSFPAIYLKIRRAKEVEVEGLDIDGKKIKIKAKGILARIFQHEIDHLDGILFFNRLNFFEKIKFRIKHPFI